MPLHTQHPVLSRRYTTHHADTIVAIHLSGRMCRQMDSNAAAQTVTVTDTSVFYPATGADGQMLSESGVVQQQGGVRTMCKVHLKHKPTCLQLLQPSRQNTVELLRAEIEALRAELRDQTPSSGLTHPSRPPSPETPEEPSHMSHKHIKINMPVLKMQKEDSTIHTPEESTGHADTVPTFLTLVHMYTDLQTRTCVHDSEEILFAGSLFRGHTAKWWAAMYGIHPRPAWFQSLLLLEREVERIFGRQDRRFEAAKQMKKLTQNKSAAEYCSKFLQYQCSDNQVVAGLRDIGDIMALEEDLKHRVLDALVAQPNEPSSLTDLADLAIQLDQPLYELRQNIQTKRKGNDAGRTTCASVVERQDTSVTSVQRNQTH
nr:hypothetical protein L203_00842 [Cryptococcus depauperatus CBS 7841]